MPMPPIPFNRPYATGREFDYIREAIARAHLAGDGMFSRRCQGWLEQQIGSLRALLTHSCTAALEMAALLADLEPGDEIIMPSFTFVSTANAFALRGAVPVFVDIRSDTLNLDERALDAAITPRTRVIVPVHYAGVPCEMDEVLAIARARGVMVVEDAAQALGSTYRNRPAGSFGDLAATSFHETKNLMSGEGGALLINAPALAARAEIVRDKGTNRSRFLRGEIDKYTWVDLGSSYVPSELTAAFLWAQMEEAASIAERRMQIWRWYYAAFADLERAGRLCRPFVPLHCRHNAHMFYAITTDAEVRDRLLSTLNAQGINAVFHYVPLHSSDAGRRFGRVHGSLTSTDRIASRLVRFPMWIGMQAADVDRIASLTAQALR
jgi:dTDP-4-amino-4,6-dideoxygalactose transaminase